jgi:hypothetical protein
MTLPRPEWLAIAVNSVIFLRYACQRPLEPGKLLYWAGGIILMAGILKMKG